MPHPHDGHLLMGSWGTPARPSPPQEEMCLLSKAMNHSEECPRVLVRCLSFGSRKGSSRSDTVKLI